MTRVNKAEATEWLGSLQQIGQGWYVNVALAVKAGAPQALGMTAREFAREIGQQLINPDEAIVELYDQKHSMRRIAEVLGVSDQRVALVLAKADRVAMTPSRQKMLDEGRISGGGGIAEWRENRATARESGDETSVPSRDSREKLQVTAKTDAEVEKLRKRVDKLTAEKAELSEMLDENNYSLQEQVRELKKRNKELAKTKAEIERQAREEAWSMMTDQERERAKKESEAWVQAETDSMLSGIAGVYGRNVCASLREAADNLRQYVDAGHGIPQEQLVAIEAAHAEFIEELNRARMSELAK